MTKKVLLHFLLLLLLTAVFTACTPTLTESESLQVSGAWVRPADEMSAAYLVITNNGRSAQQLVRVETTAANTAEIHETQMDGDLMQMRPVEAVEILAGETVQLKPGGEHIMLMGLTAPLVAGDTIIELNNQGEDAHDLHVQRSGSDEELSTPETEPGTQSRIRFTTTPGTYRLWCSLPNHASWGMDTTFEAG